MVMMSRCNSEHEDPRVVHLSEKKKTRSIPDAPSKSIATQHGLVGMEK